MPPQNKILWLFGGWLFSVLLGFFCGLITSSGGDAAGAVLGAALTSGAIIVAGTLVCGKLALAIARENKQQLPAWARILPQVILNAPVLWLFLALYNAFASDLPNAPSLLILSAVLGVLSALGLCLFSRSRRQKPSFVAALLLPLVFSLVRLMIAWRENQEKDVVTRMFLCLLLSGTIFLVGAAAACLVTGGYRIFGKDRP